VQFNNLTVESVSSASVPAEIVATGGGIGVDTPPVTCLVFPSATAAGGAPTACPMLPAPTPASPSPTKANTSAGAGSSGSGIGTPATPLQPYYEGFYRVEVSATTELMLRDRSSASLSDFTQGDQINVFGYYNTDGSIQAYLVRDISKPEVTQTMQLDNVTLNSISGTSIPATLAVTQASGYPCYGFTGNTPATIACPMGVSSFSANPATANATALPSLMPIWQMLRKYVVTVDAQTIILDRNRTELSLSSLNLGDSLNVYGESSDNGQTIAADIIRDLSIPATASVYSGTVTAVNADGSFVIHTGNGQTLTVQNPIVVGQTVTVHGLLNPSNSTISSVSNITIGTPILVPLTGQVQAAPPSAAH